MPGDLATLAGKVKQQLVALGVSEPEPAVDAVLIDEVAALVRGRALEHLNDIPAFPRDAAEILELARNPLVDLDELVRKAGKDAAVSLEIVRVANSAASAARTPIKSVRDAAVRLGSRQTAMIAASVSARSLFDPSTRFVQRRDRVLWDWLWAHSITTAFACSTIAGEVGGADPGRSFLGGLFHEVGALPVMRALGDQEAHVSVRELGLQQTLQVIDRLHVEIGERMAHVLRLPGDVGEAAYLHHEPPANDRVLHVVRLVSSVNAVTGGTCARPSVIDELAGSLLALDLTERSLISTARQVSEAAQRMAA